MTFPTLYDYQQRGIDETRACFGNGARCVLYQGPTGCGKTVLFAAVVAGAAARNKRVAILGHRDEILQQIDTALDSLNVAHGIVAAGYAESPLMPVQIASVATLVRRLHRVAGGIDLLVIDEAHHAAAGMWRKILAAFPTAKVLGVTATPQRLDGKGLDDIFDVLVTGPTVSELITQGYLSKFATFAPARTIDLSGIKTRAGDYMIEALAARMSKGVIITGAVDDYERLVKGAPTIAFCVDIDHSQRVAEAFRERGYRAAHLDGETPTAERRRLIAALATGELQLLSNCGLIAEGLDVPGVTAVILLRPTKSLALYLQQVGRALRPAPGKQRALILDHAGNAFRFGPADAPRKWSLEGCPKESGEPPYRRCPECGAINPLAAMICAECGAELRPSGPRCEIKSPALVEINRLAIMSYQQAMRWAGGDEHRLRLVAKARGYKPGWVWYRLQELREESA
jgi:superfamily II DNA or RNA helicase